MEGAGAVSAGQISARIGSDGTERRSSRRRQLVQECYVQECNMNKNINDLAAVSIAPARLERIETLEVYSSAFILEVEAPKPPIGLMRSKDPKQRMKVPAGSSFLRDYICIHSSWHAIEVRPLLSLGVMQHLCNNVMTCRRDNR